MGQIAFATKTVSNIASSGIRSRSARDVRGTRQAPGLHDSFRFWEACDPSSMEATVREIEVKYRVEDMEALLVALKSRGIELSEPVFQDDQAYAPAGWQFGDSKLGVSFLRLRTVAGRHYFTLKQPADSAQACLEYETQVTDRQAMHYAAMHMGYRPTVWIAKTRRVATLDDCSLCVDDVEGIGGFLELEHLEPDDADTHTVQAGLAAFVSSLGIAATRTDQTYDSLVHAAQGQASR